jgi:hypothetical protein
VADREWRKVPAAGEPVAGAVYYRQARGANAELAVLAVDPQGEGRVTLSDTSGAELFSHRPGELRFALASRAAFELQRGEDRWLMSGTCFKNGKGLDELGRLIDRRDVILVVPMLADMPDREYERLLGNPSAQQAAWCGFWSAVLEHAGATVDSRPPARRLRGWRSR